MKRWGICLLAAFAVLGASAIPAAAAPDRCTPGSEEDCLNRLPLSADASLPYYASFPLSGNAEVTRAVVVIHGTGRNADGYFESMNDAADGAGVAEDTEVVAPWFQADEDDPADGDAYWTNGGETSWKDGGDALQPEGFSSFSAMDELLAALADKAKFPKLTTITIAGHSAGGQFVQRYAATGRAPDGVRFVTANPSSYLYLNDKRPADTSDCPEYNEYKYGLEKPNRYVGALTAQQIKDRYAHRQVVYLLGGEDVHHDHSIDLDCPAMAQGDNRLARGKSYFAAIHKMFPDAPHRMVIVPGVGHDDGEMFGSEQGRSALFG